MMRDIDVSHGISQSFDKRNSMLCDEKIAELRISANKIKWRDRLMCLSVRNMFSQI